jgi:CheY-like chemotaxis protein
VAIRWTQSDGGNLELSWMESGGPEVTVPTRRGFGSTLIERALAMETGGQANLRYLPTGVVCEIWLPPAALVQSELPDAPAMSALSDAGGSRLPAPTGKRILVVEDSFMVVGMLEMVFASVGWTMVGPAARVPAALALIASERFDAALLDINLDGEMSWAVATELQARKIPLVLSTGYEISAVLPDALKNIRSVRKPYNITQLEQAILEALSGEE